MQPAEDGAHTGRAGRCTQEDSDGGREGAVSGNRRRRGEGVFERGVRHMIAATNGPLLDARDGEAALAYAERIFERALPWLDEHAGFAPESLSEWGGAVLVADALVRAGRIPAGTLHQMLRRALVTAPDRRGLYDGRAGLLAVLDALDPEGAAFARPRASLRAAIGAELLETRELDLADRKTFDLISGAAGKVIALRDAPDDVVAHVRALFTEFADRVEARLAQRAPNAVRLDIGVAHGLPGVLAGLNLALPGEGALARRYTELVLATSHDVGGARRWDGHWDPDAIPPPRRAWCYQTVGVAAVLHDRALIDRDDALRALALEALAATVHDQDSPHWDDALCHGRAGVALIYARVANEDARFAQAARELAHTIFTAYRDDVPFGYRTMNLRDMVHEDRPQFLDAALGVALFLIEAAQPGERRWLPVLGLLPGGSAR